MIIFYPFFLSFLNKVNIFLFLIILNFFSFVLPYSFLLQESVVVIEVHPFGAAYKDGRLRKGDLILAVNDISYREISWKDAVRVLREAPSPLKLMVLRENPQILFTTSQGEFFCEKFICFMSIFQFHFFSKRTNTAFIAIIIVILLFNHFSEKLYTKNKSLRFIVTIFVC